MEVAKRFLRKPISLFPIFAALLHEHLSEGHVSIVQVEAQRDVAKNLSQPLMLSDL
jgi:hypothetical protein